MDNKPYVCRKMRLLTFLIKNGFYPFASRIDNKDNTRLVWLFNDSVELRCAIESYYNN